MVSVARSIGGAMQSPGVVAAVSKLANKAASKETWLCQ